MDLSEFADELERRFKGQESSNPLPRDLATLFRFTFDPTPHSRVILSLLQKHLLKGTIRHAKSQTRFYSDYATSGWGPTGPDRPPDLSCWPIIKRKDIIDSFDDLIARDVTFESACHTSGSTGPSLTIYKSSEELSYLWSYYYELIKPTFERMDSLPISLFFPNLYHGSPVRLPSFGRVFVGGVTDDMLIQDALKVLQKSYNIPGHDSRVSILSGLSFHIKFFTNFLLEQGYNPREFGIRSMNIVGEYVSNLSRRFLADSWGAILIERFTLTESVGGANRCFLCGHFHLDPHVIGEVVDPDSVRPLDEGVGYLLLTQLYPFVQMQPLIRYYTGDLVRKIRSDCSNSMTFDFLGKTSNCVQWKPDGKAEWLLYSVDLYEIINELPDVRLYDTWPNIRSVKDTTVSSPPIYTQTTSSEDARPFTITLAFELRYSPNFFQARAAELQNKIRDGLRQANSALARRLEETSVALDIRLVGPGTLADAHRIKI